MSMDDLNWLIGELRGAPRAHVLAQCVDTYKCLNREYAQIARPYLRAHKSAILALNRNGGEWQPTVELIDTLPIERMVIAGDTVSITRDNARGIYDKIRRAYRGRKGVSLDLALVCDATIRLDLAHAPVYASASASASLYTGRWFLEEAREHALAITGACREASATVEEGESVWSVWRAALRAACEHVDSESWIHEAHEQAAYAEETMEAEHQLVCEVAGALHPTLAYSQFRRAAEGEGEYTLLHALYDALHSAGIYAETEEGDGSIYAYLPNTRELRELLDQIAHEWHGTSADPEEIQDAIARALDWAH